ncbi:hypothetical protein D3C72_752720 [compost metagenome]
MSRRVRITIMMTKLISMIFMTLFHCTHDDSGIRANGAVTFIHMTNNSSSTLTGVSGRFFGSRVITRLIRVAMAMMKANGMWVAKPQPCVCGFITLTQTHIRPPVAGVFRMKGREPRMMMVISMSRMKGDAPGCARVGKVLMPVNGLAGRLSTLDQHCLST